MTDNVPTRRLGFIETALALNDSYRPMNAVAVLQLTGPVDQAALRVALDHLQRRDPALRARLLRGRRPRFGYGEPAPIPLEVVGREGPDTWVGVAESALVTPIPMDGEPGLRVALVQGSGDDGELVAALNHAVGDAASFANLLHRLLLIHAAAVAGEPLSFPEALPPPPPVEELFPPHLRGARLHARRARLLAGSMLAEAGYQRKLRRHRAFRVQPEFSLQILPGEIDAATTSRLRRRARSRRLTLHSVVQAAMLLSVHRAFYAGAALSLRTFAFADLRPYLRGGLAAEPLAAYMAMTWHDVPLDPSSDLWTVAGAVQGKVYQAIGEGGKFVASAAAAPLMRMTLGLHRLRMGNTAASFSGTVPLDSEYGAVALRGVHGFISNHGLGPEWAIWGGLFQGRLVLDAVTLDCDMSRQQMAEVGTDMRALLVDAAGPVAP